MFVVCSHHKLQPLGSGVCWLASMIGLLTDAAADMVNPTEVHDDAKSTASQTLITIGVWTASTTLRNRLTRLYLTLCSINGPQTWCSCHQFVRMISRPLSDLLSALCVNMAATGARHCGSTRCNGHTRDLRLGSRDFIIETRYGSTADAPTASSLTIRFYRRTDPSAKTRGTTRDVRRCKNSTAE